ncbi:MAG: hypothetical protein LBC76_10560 [Treponema sp.]|jgi:hypothetical protein|nr:hypothetical protein [Treponema sp.]
MKRNILAVIFILFAFSFIYGQNNGPIDLILLLNTSSGMSSSYENVNNYITGPFLSEFLRTGDTFHLIVFSQSPRLDIARRINQRGDVETIIGRMLLQYPVENGNNPAAAITFTENYISSLPSRLKKIVFVTTVDQDINTIVNTAKNNFRAKNATFDFVQVTAGQPLTNLPKSGRDVVSSGTGSASVTTSQGTPSPGGVTSVTGSASGITSQETVSAGAVTSGTSSAAGTASQGTPSTSAVTSGTDSASGTTSQETVSAGAVTSGTNSASGITSQGTASADTSSSGITAIGEIGTPAQSSSGSQSSVSVESSSANDVNGKDGTSAQISEKTQGNENVSKNEKTSGSVKTSSGAKSGSSSVNSIGLIFLFIFLILILGIIIFLISRRISSGSARRPAAPVSRQKLKEERPAASDRRPVAPAAKQEPKEKSRQITDHNRELANYAAAQQKQRTTPYSDRPIKTENQKPSVMNFTDPLFLKMFVEDQSLSIGKRNIHSLKSGYSLSVGGGKSDFLIFLVPVPPNIGELRRSGNQLTFIPRKQKYFPDLGSSELRDCLNKTIRIISDRNYEIRFRFEIYEDPLLALNRVLHSIKIPG